MDLGLAGRVHVLTGASRGLGYAVAEQLVADGGRVAAFLLSPAASYLTGIAVPIDGGALRSL